MARTAIWVVVSRPAMDPSREIHYWCFTGSQRATAYRRMIRRHQKAIQTDVPQVIRALRVNVPVSEREDIIAFIEDNIDKLAVSTPARAQIIPLGTHPDVVPTVSCRYPGQDEDMEDILAEVPEGDNPF